MKDDIKSLEIEPFDAFLDFDGPIRSATDAGSSRVLKGVVRLSLSKPLKVRQMVVKFKGGSRVVHQNSLGPIDISTPLLPKPKAFIHAKSTVLPAGDGQTLPWEIQIPNIYPSSLLVKRAAIHYKVEVSIAIGSLHTRYITAEYPIVLRRFLLPSVFDAPSIRTKLYQDSFSSKFHYELNMPRIACVEQGKLPFAVRYKCIGSQKPVRCIRTRLIQVELYKCQTISKAEYNMESWPSTRRDKRPTTGRHPSFAKYTKRTLTMVEHHLPDTLQPWKTPLVLYHTLDEYLAPNIESPLAWIQHHLEITFQFNDAKYRTSVPIVITPIPTRDETNRSDYCASLLSLRTMTTAAQPPKPIPQYFFESNPHYQALEAIPMVGTALLSRSKQPFQTYISPRSSMGPLEEFSTSRLLVDSEFDTKLADDSMTFYSQASGESETDLKVHSSIDEESLSSSPTEEQDEVEREEEDKEGSEESDMFSIVTAISAAVQSAEEESKPAPRLTRVRDLPPIDIELANDGRMLTRRQTRNAIRPTAQEMASRANVAALPRERSTRVFVGNRASLCLSAIGGFSDEGDELGESDSISSRVMSMSSRYADGISSPTSVRSTASSPVFFTRPPSNSDKTLADNRCSVFSEAPNRPEDLDVNDMGAPPRENALTVQHGRLEAKACNTRQDATVHLDGDHKQKEKAQEHDNQAVERPYRDTEDDHETEETDDLEDDDDSQIHPLSPIEFKTPTVQPPQLPRLSLGTAFSALLELNED